MGMWPIIFGAASGIGDLWSSHNANQFHLEQAEKAKQGLQEYLGNYDPAAINRARQMPSFSFQGRTFSPPGTSLNPGSPATASPAYPSSPAGNFGDFMGNTLAGMGLVPNSAKAAMASGYGPANPNAPEESGAASDPYTLSIEDMLSSSTNFGELTGSANTAMRDSLGSALGLLGDARMDPAALAGSIGDYYGDVTFDEYLNNAINASGESSMGRLENFGPQAQIAAMKGGGGMGAVGDAMRTNQWNEARTRSGEIAGARAQQEALGAEYGARRADAMAQARLAAMANNTSLATTGAGATMSAGNTMSGNIRDIGLAGAQQEDVDQVQAYQAWLDMINATDTTGQLDEKKWQAAMAGGSWDVGVPYAGVMPSNYINSTFSNYRAANQPNQKGGFGFSILGTGVNSSCVDAEAEVVVPDGLKKLKDVTPLDTVMGTDGQFHRVVAKDCGEIPEDNRPFYMEVTTDDGQRLVMTDEHPIGSGIALDLAVGDVLEVGPEGREVLIADISIANYRATGDLLLAGCNGYIANGIHVGSALSVLGLSRWKDRIETLGFVPHNGYNHAVTNPGNVWVVDKE